MKRKKISKGVRFDIFRRDKFTCQYCGRNPPDVVLHLDHIVAVANGGNDDPINLVTSCQDCNLGKSAKDLDSIPQSLADSVAERRERSEQMEEFNRFLMELKNKDDTNANTLGVFWCDQFASQQEKGKWTVCDRWKTSLKTFMKHLAIPDIMEFMELANSAVPSTDRDNCEQTWKYFCGICWNRIKAKRGTQQ